MEEKRASQDDWSSFLVDLKYCMMPQLEGTEHWTVGYKPSKEELERLKEKLNPIRQISLLPYSTQFVHDRMILDSAFALFRIRDPSVCIRIYGLTTPRGLILAEFTDLKLKYLEKLCPNLEVLYAPYAEISASVLEKLASRLHYLAILREPINCDQLEMKNFINLKAFDVTLHKSSWCKNTWNYFMTNFPDRFVQRVYMHSIEPMQGQVLYLSLFPDEGKQVANIPENVAQSLAILRVRDVTFDPIPTLNNLFLLSVRHNAALKNIFDLVKGSVKLEGLHIDCKIPPKLAGELTELLMGWKQIRRVSISFVPERTDDQEVVFYPFIVPVISNLIQLYVYTESMPITLKYVDCSSLDELLSIDLTCSEKAVVEIGDLIAENLIYVNINKLPVGRTDVLKVLSQCQFLKNVSIEYDLDYRTMNEQEIEMLKGRTNILPPSLLKKLSIKPVLESVKTENRVTSFIKWSFNMKFIFHGFHPAKHYLNDYFPSEVTLQNQLKIPATLPHGGSYLNHAINYQLNNIDTKMRPWEILRQGLILMGLAEIGTEATEPEPVAGPSK